MRPCILQPTEPKVLLWKGYLKVPTMHSPQMWLLVLQPTEPEVLLWKGCLKVCSMQTSRQMWKIFLFPFDSEMLLLPDTRCAQVGLMLH